jgi:hypothetical protein
MSCPGSLGLVRVVLLAAVAALVALVAGCGPDKPEDDLSRFVAPAPGWVSDSAGR